MKALLAISINLTAIALLFLFQIAMAASILIGLSLLGWFFYYLWQRQNLVQQRLNITIDGHKIIQPMEHVMFRAQASAGYSQTSGMGYLVLTDQGLYFELALLDLVICVPNNNLTSAEYVYRLKGVSPGQKMLQISYLDANGEPDAIAVTMENMDLWLEAIISVIKTVE